MSFRIHLVYIDVDKQDRIKRTLNGHQKHTYHSLNSLAALET